MTAAFPAEVPRRPRGVYAVVDIESLINQQAASQTAAEMDTYFNSLYRNLLGNTAIAGLTLQAHWDRLNPNTPPASNAYSWNVIDDAFAQVAVWNNENPTQPPKTIQLIVTPGFQSPQWVLSEIPSCDGLFQTPAVTPSSTCGEVTFTGYGEAGDGTVLPLPWNPLYKSAWKTFLTALAARYGSNPAFVSIAVAGPTAASAEMTTASNGTATAQLQFGGIQPNEMWRQLFAFHYVGLAAYQNSDQAFIDEWNAAVDVFGQVFSGITLVATTGSGFPNFNNNFALPSAFQAICPNPNMQCAAVASILSHFADPTVGGANAKATQTSGMEAARAATPGNVGVAAVQWLSQNTAKLSSPSAQILGGAQFNTSFSNDPVVEGCTAAFPPDAGDTPAACMIPSSCTTNRCIPVACIPQACLAIGVTQTSLTTYGTFSKVPNNDLISPEQAAYNVLNVYFNGSAAASSFGGTPGATPLNYLQIYSPDIQYAEMNVNGPAQILQPDGVIVSTTAQQLLDQASEKLASIAEPQLPPAIDPGGIVPGAIQPGEWVSIYGANLGANATWTGNFPTSLGGASVTIDRKPAYLSFTSYGQINLQAPSDSATGTVPLVVTTSAGSVTAQVTLGQFSPSFFLLDGRHVAGIILRSNRSGAYGSGAYDIIGPPGTSLGYPTVAAKAGDTIELFGTGFGTTNPSVPAGAPFSGAAPTISAVTVRIDSTNVAPSFSGLSGAGLYQFNLTIPGGLGTGDVALQALVGGLATPSGVVISLQ
jgi:uncharacterized protein (TIGR03437 family)